MDNDEFDWQGKKKEDIEFSYRMVFWGTVTCIIILFELTLQACLEKYF